MLDKDVRDVSYFGKRVRIIHSQLIKPILHNRQKQMTTIHVFCRGAYVLFVPYFDQLTLNLNVKLYLILEDATELIPQRMHA